LENDVGADKLHQMTRMRRRILGAALALWVLFPVRTPALEHQEFLWVITNRSATVYLLGSIHVLRSADYPLAKVFDQAFDQASQVVFEVKAEDLSSPETANYILKRAKYATGDSIRQHISADTYRLLQDYRTSTGANFSDQFCPWYLAALIVGQETQRAGYSEDLGVDQHYAREARSRGKQVRALETATFQIDLFADTPEAQQERELRELLLDSGAVAQSAGDLVEFWKTGNVAELDKTLGKMRTDEADSYRRFFSDRNNRWVAQIESYLNLNTTTLVIGGAGHFVAQDGVVALLRNKGLLVQQLPKLFSRFVNGRQLADGAISLDFEPITGHRHALEATGNVVAWQPIHNFISSASTTNYVDLAARDLPQRFYRLKILDALGWASPRARSMH